jgi:GxxExxY protein
MLARAVHHGAAMEHNTDLLDQQTYDVIGAAMEVHTHLGGFGEIACTHALAIELQLRGIPFQTEVPFPIFYKGHKLPSVYRADFICWNSLLVELKSIGTKTGPQEQAQMLKYLRASGLGRALLFNFGLPRLEYRRFVMSANVAPSEAST